MKSKILLATLLLALVPAVSAVEVTEDLNAAVNDIASFITKIDQSTQEWGDVDDGTGPKGYILADNADSVAVTYTLYAFDRNGEVDLNLASIDLKLYAPDTAPGNVGEQQLVTVASVATNSVGASLSGCTGMTQQTDFHWQGQFPDDGHAANGAGKCDFIVTFNDGAASTPGEYVLEATVGGNTERIVTLVYEKLDVLVTLTNAATSIDFGTFNPTGADLDAGGQLKVSNSNSGTFSVDLTVTDMTGPAGTHNTIEKSLLRLNEAKGTAAGTPGTSFTAGVYDSPETVAAGEFVQYAFRIATASSGTNSILQHGAYTGTMTIAIAGATGGDNPYIWDGTDYAPATPQGSVTDFAIDRSNDGDGPDGLGDITLS